MFNCIYRPLFYDQFPTISVLILDNVFDERVKEYAKGNAYHGIAAIEQRIIVSDAYAGYIPN